MARPKIAVIISTTRATRFGEKPAQWIHDMAAARADMSVELIDLRDYPMPFFDEAASNAWVPAKNPVAQRWQKKVAEFDGYIFVTAEYNRGIPAVLKNASITPIRNGTASLPPAWDTEVSARPVRSSS